ncbi:MAG: ClbS/DfsB family four-helix bundle protein [Cyclobacteriaceae bacterium]|nr:ClbS/DfsB family four-helix bundle protein [Cyclobacteriaceae bacterium HetDA_MAG_MS6]
MSRPKNKSELLIQSATQYDRLMALVKSFEEIEITFPEGYLNRNVKDVLAHLHQWHLMMLDWYSTGMKGIKPEIPAKGYTWKTTPDLNREIWKKYKDVPLKEVIPLLHRSHQEVSHLIEKHTNDELFEKKRYKWTGTTSLGAYLISATSSHYDWASKLIRKCMKASLETEST